MVLVDLYSSCSVGRKIVYKKAGRISARISCVFRGQWQSYSSARNDQVQLSPSGTHQSAEFLANAVQQAQSVVFCERGKEVLDCAGLVTTARVLFKLSNDLGLVVVGKSGRGDDALESGLGAHDLVKRCERLCSGV